MFTGCLADPVCATLYRSAVASAATTIGALGLDSLADTTAELLRPWQERDPRREATLADIDAAVAGVHDFLSLRAGEAATWLTPPVVIGVPDRAPNGAGWYDGPVTINWQAIDASGSATDPPDTVASTEGANVVYSSGLSCDPSYNCAIGSLALSIDSVAPSLAPTTSPATILLTRPRQLRRTRVTQRPVCRAKAVHHPTPPAPARTRSCAPRPTTPET
jgi:hypothetical protein